MKKVYVVKGSEDGNLGVYSSKARALKVAKAYVANAEESPVTDFSVVEYSWSILVSSVDSWVTADIEIFEINA